MFCILLGQDPNAVSDSALECFGRGNNLLWPTGAPSLIIRSMPLATSWALPALCKSDTGFQFPARLNTYCSAGVKKGLFIFVCEFVHYVPARRKNAISILSAYYEHFRGLLAVSVPGTSIGVDLTLGHLKQLSREPRRIEILGQNKLAHFQSKVA